jgi:hypothetical protein
MSATRNDVCVTLPNWQLARNMEGRQWWVANDYKIAGTPAGLERLGVVRFVGGRALPAKGLNTQISRRLDGTVAIRVCPYRLIERDQRFRSSMARVLSGAALPDWRPPKAPRVKPLKLTDDEIRNALLRLTAEARDRAIQAGIAAVFGRHRELSAAEIEAARPRVLRAALLWVRAQNASRGAYGRGS